MTDRETNAPKNPARAAREKRLAEALRANLRRRKHTPRGEPASTATNQTTTKTGESGPDTDEEA
jgi:hypothetical protein